MTLNPRYADALEGRARVLQRLKRFKEAIADYNALLRINPPNAEIVYNLGGAYEGAGQRDNALRSYERALEISPAHSPTLAAKALLLYDDGCVDDALETLREALAADPLMKRLGITAERYSPLSASTPKLRNASTPPFGLSRPTAKRSMARPPRCKSWSAWKKRSRPATRS